jgi:16S rRNA (cytosine1402-N4)-methyltransferase
MTSFSHIPVLRDEAVAMLAPRPGAVYLDGTFGGGGYAKAILDAADCTLLAIDRDPAAILRAEALARQYSGRLQIHEGRFSDVFQHLGSAGELRLAGAVFDLGVSSYQIDDAARGFSFRQDGPLDMQMGGAAMTAERLVNTAPEAELADILYRFGEEKASRRIAQAIVARRGLQKFTTTAELASVIRSVVRPDKSGIDPATRSFQALRIAVNDELGEVAAALAQAAALLGPGGRLVVVSFHSLEDRIVKQFFAQAAGRGPGISRHDPAALQQAGRQPAAKPEFKLLTARPVLPGPAEIQANPRARSARLRAMERFAA